MNRKENDLIFESYLKEYAIADEQPLEQNDIVDGGSNQVVSDITPEDASVEHEEDNDPSNKLDTYVNNTLIPMLWRDFGVEDEEDFSRLVDALIDLLSQQKTEF